MKKVSKTRQCLTSLDTDRLEALQAELQAHKGAFARVGFLGRDSDRGEKLNNPTLGAIHELGSASSQPPVPRRSILKEPIIEKLPERIQQMGPETWRKAILEKGVIYSLKVLGIEAENVVQGAFATGGYGRWQPLAPSTIARKGSTAILIETAKLRKSVHSDVVTK